MFARSSWISKVEITKEILNTWDACWVQQNTKFDTEIAQTPWKDLSSKMLYTWDGNHRPATWMGVLQGSLGWGSYKDVSYITLNLNIHG